MTRKDPKPKDTCPICKSPVAPFKIHGSVHIDPFCSTVCCKKWHRVKITVNPSTA